MVALLYSYAWRPAIQGYAQLSKELPQLRSQVVTMRSEAEHAKRLQRQVSIITLSDASLSEALHASLQKEGFSDAQLSVTDGVVQLGLTKANFSQWVTWLNKISRENQLQLQSAQITTLPMLGQVDVSAVVASAQNSTIDPAGSTLDN
jgi:type II secretory pathway component PulM